MHPILDHSNPTAVAIALLALCSPASSRFQEATRSAPEPLGGQPVQVDMGGIELGLRYSFWVADFTFESTTASELAEFDGVIASGLELYSRWPLSELWGLHTGVEYSFGGDLTALLVDVSATHHLDLIPTADRSYLRAGLLYGQFDIDDVHGDFDDSIGFQGGIGADWRLENKDYGRWTLNAEAMLRYIEFDFDPAAAALSADSSAGGLGLRLAVGLQYRL